MTNMTMSSISWLCMFFIKQKTAYEPRISDWSSDVVSSDLIEVSDKAFDLLGNVGFDPVYGARPLKRAIQQQLENPLASKILAGEFGNGDTVRVDAEGGHLVFEKA